MDDWNPWPQPAVPQTVVVYRHDGAGELEFAAMIGFVIGAVFGLLLQAVRLLVWLVAIGVPLLAWLVVAGGQALHAAAAGRLLDAPAPAVAARPEAVRC